MTGHPPSQTDLITAFLHDRDVECPACRYNLRAAGSDRCPECGWVLSLSITQPGGQPRGWWLSAMFGLVVSAFVAILLLVPALDAVASNVNDPRIAMMVRAGAASPSQLPNWGLVIRLIGLVMIIFTALAWLWATRARFAARQTWLRIALSLLAIASPLILLGLAYAWTK